MLYAQNSVLDAEVALLGSRRDSYVARATLLRRMGELEAGKLLASPRLYDAARYTRKRVRSGDKQAQLELGIAFEEGRGLPVDKDRAVKLYRQAAADSGGTIWVYMPSPGSGAKGHVVPVDRGSGQAGLLLAKQRLAASRSAEHPRRDEQ